MRNACILKSEKEGVAQGYKTSPKPRKTKTKTKTKKEKTK